VPIQRKGRYLEIEFGWPKLSSAGTIKVVSLSMLLLGLISLLAAAIYDSYVTAFVGLGLALWGALLLAIAPTKYVKLKLLTAASSSQASNTEKMLNLAETNHKGVYLPPKLLRDYLSSLIFVPATDNEALPKREEIPEEKALGTPQGLFLTPPGQALSRLFEEELGKSFTELNLNRLATELPSLLDRLGITKTALMNVEGRKVTFETGNYIFKDLCLETRNFQRTHETVGCPFSSAIACALAKASGKPLTIEKEETTQDQTIIEYRMLED
jgi:hypothetical protein